MLGDCLASLRGVVDEIIVVDTGSLDRSVAIATEFGAVVSHHVWNDDFAEARNRSLDAATGEWVLYIDADERLVADREAVERVLRGADEAGFRILLRPERSTTPYLEYRLWRNDPRIRFEGSMHERVVPSVHRVADEDGRPISNCFELLLEHVGYEGDQRRKHERNLPMLLAFLEGTPDHVFARHHLAMVLEGLGRADEAEDVLRATVERIRTRDLHDPAGVLAYAALVERLRDSGREHADLLGEARTLYPDNCVLIWIEARDLIDRADYEGAIARCRDILAVGADGAKPGRPAYDLELLGAAPWALIGYCLFKLERYGESADAYREAERCAPDDPGHRSRRLVAERRAGSDPNR